MAQEPRNVEKVKKVKGKGKKWDYLEVKANLESSVKQIPYPQQAVYDNISDLRNLEKVQDRVPEDKVNDFKYDEDTVSLNVAPVGELKLRICEREESISA